MLYSPTLVPDVPPSYPDSRISYINVVNLYDLFDLFRCFKALWYSCTLVPPCAAATSPTHCCEMWLASPHHLPIVTSQWVFTVTSLDRCSSSHFINGAVTSALAKHFVHCKF